jgi:hypothetical protein
MSGAELSRRIRITMETLAIPFNDLGETENEVSLFRTTVLPSS